MTDEQLAENGSRVFPTQEAAERLRRIGRWEPLLENRFMSEFCAFLGGRIGSHRQIVVEGFQMAFVLVLEDAKAGKDGFTGEPMPRDLTGQHPMIYNMMLRYMPLVAKAAFGEEFGQLVEAQMKGLGL